MKVYKCLLRYLAWRAKVAELDRMHAKSRNGVMKLILNKEKPTA